MPATSAAGLSSVRYRTAPRRFVHLRPTGHHAGAHSSNCIKTRLEKKRRSPITRAAGDGSVEPLDAVVFTLIVDDLVFPDGKTKMGVLGQRLLLTSLLDGGGGPQTAFGIRCHPGDLSVGFAAGVGPDLPPECTSWLEANDIDTSGLAFVRDGNRDDDDDGKGDGKGDGDGWEGGGVDASDFISAAAADASSSRYRATPRAWQITEHDGRRTQVWRTPACPALYAMLRPPARVLPARYAAARAFHVGVHPERPDLVLLDALKASNAGALISVEPFTHAASPRRPSSPVSHERLRRLCTAGDIFSPNELEAISLVGAGTPTELVTRLAAAGARVVCLRRGAEGAVVHDAATGEIWSVPAVLGGGASLENKEVDEEKESKEEEETHARSPTKSSASDAVGEVVDVTGCGNAFCGGFLASRLAGEGLLDGAVWGSVAASLMAEAVGVPEQPAGGEEFRREAARRAEALKMLGRKLA